MKLHLVALTSAVVSTFCLSAAAQTVGGEVAQQPPTALQHVVPDWLSRATGEDMMRVYPEAALRRGVEGIALVTCEVSKSGEMTGCAVEQEAPRGQGFGGAALALMPKFRMRPPTRDGVAVDGAVVRLPIQFRMPR